MIPEFSKRVSDLLQVRGFPFPVLYAPERATRLGYANLVTFARARSGERISLPDSSGARSGADGVRVAAWYVAGVCDVCAQSSQPGATIGDHETFCDHLSEMVICAMLDVAMRDRWEVSISGARIVAESERSQEEQAAGVIFRIEFLVGRGVFRHGFDFDMPEFAEIQAIENVPTQLLPESEDDEEDEDETP